MEDKLIALLLLSAVMSVSCEDLTPDQSEDNSLEDTSVTLSYTYPKLSMGDYFFWYRQRPGEPPQILTHHSATGEISDSDYPGLKIQVKQKQIFMTIISALVTDSAVYYCALQTASGTSWKIHFGEGTKLIIESKNFSEPAYYSLGDGEDTACLATGFSRFNATKDVGGGLYNGTEPTRGKDERTFSQVAFLKSEQEEETCSTLEAASGVCERLLEPDPTVNFLSLTVLGLRLIFIKTVIFNVLMTYKLWIRQ